MGGRVDRARALCTLTHDDAFSDPRYEVQVSPDDPPSFKIWVACETMTASISHASAYIHI